MIVSRLSSRNSHGTNSFTWFIFVFHPDAPHILFHVIRCWTCVRACVCGCDFSVNLIIAIEAIGLKSHIWNWNHLLRCMIFARLAFYRCFVFSFIRFNSIPQGVFNTFHLFHLLRQCNVYGFISLGWVFNSLFGFAPFYFLFFFFFCSFWNSHNIGTTNVTIQRMWKCSLWMRVALFSLHWQSHCIPLLFVLVFATAHSFDGMWCINTCFPVQKSTTRDFFFFQTEQTEQKGRMNVWAKCRKNSKPYRTEPNGINGRQPPKMKRNIKFFAVCYLNVNAYETCHIHIHCDNSNIICTASEGDQTNGIHTTHYTHITIRNAVSKSVYDWVLKSHCDINLP